MGKTRITNESYDEHLSFSLPKGYYTERVVNDEGEQSFQIRAGETTDSEGNKTPKFVANVTLQEESSTTNSDAGIVLNGNYVNRIVGGSREMSLGPINITIYIIGIGIDYKGSVYTINAQRAGIRDVDDWIEFLDTVIQSVRIDGEPGSFERFTQELFESACESHDEIDDYGYPKATPDAGQHEHLDFLTRSKSKMSLFGGMLTVNATGTEYSFYRLSEVFDDDDESARTKAIRTITNKGTSPFPLAEKARQMSHVFRVSPDFFDPGHDRENEIDSGLIQRALTYNQFRSFAWTLTAYCEENGVEPGDVSYDELEGITAFIEKRNGLNYKADSYSPVLCSGNDIHVYYIPDSINASTKKHLLNNDDDNIAESVRSLDGLRKELEYLYPAMQTICNQLVKEREVEEPLIGGTADILYAWCSMTYAAREPIYTEDGPVNCMWEPPGSELRWQEELLKNEVARKKTWLLDHKKDLDTKTRITVKDKLFVFSGAENLEEWEKIHNELIRQGGVYRSAVSGKTDYLVCNSTGAGESKVKKALEQRSKGSGIKIILLEDLLKELGMQISVDPETRLKELQSQYVTTGKNIKKPEREPDLSIIQREAFTYNEHQIARGDGYSFDIPDGFVIKENAEDRDFVAYIPTEDDPEDYDQSRFVIFAIEKTENEAFKQFRIPLEYWSVFTDFKRALTQDFEKTIKENYYRKDLPGVILFGHDPGVLHVMLMLYIKDHIQMFRLIINGVDRKERYGYECLVKSLLEHVHADEPAPTLKALDDIEFLNAEVSSNSSKEWIQCAVDYLNHIDSAKMIMRNQLFQGFQSDQQEHKADVTRFKVNIKKMLKTCSEYTDEILKQATAFYLLKRIEDPDNRLLKNIKDSILKIADVADQSIKMNEQELKVESAFAEKVRNNIDKKADEFLLELLQDYKDDSSETYTKLKQSVTETEDIRKRRQRNNLSLSKYQSETEENQHSEVPNRFEVSYSDEVYQKVGNLYYAIPDHLKTNLDKDADKEELNELQEEIGDLFALVVCPKEKSFVNSADAPLAIVIQKSQDIGQLGIIVKSNNIENPEVIFKKILTAQLEQSGLYYGQEIKYLNTNGLHIVYGAQRTSWQNHVDTFLIFGEEDLIAGRLYYSGKEMVENSSSITEEWLSKITKKEKSASKKATNREIAAPSKSTTVTDLRLSKYQDALKASAAEDLYTLRSAQKIFEMLGEYKDSAQKLQELNLKINELEAIEQAGKQKSYEEALDLLKENTQEATAKAAVILRSIRDYKDAEEHYQNAKQQAKKWQLYTEGLELTKKNNTEDLSKAVRLLTEAGDFKDSEDKLEKAQAKLSRLQEKEAEKNEQIYQEAIKLLEVDTRESIDQAISRFRKILGYKDADSRLSDASRLAGCWNIYSKAVKTAENDDAVSLECAIRDLKLLKYFRDSEELISVYKKRLEEIKINDAKYQDALKKAKTKNIPDLYAAVQMFNDLNGFKDSTEWVETLETEIKDLEEKAEQERLSTYQKAINQAESDNVPDLNRAITAFEKLKDYKDSSDQAEALRARVKALEEKTEQERLERERKAAEEKAFAEKKKKRNRILIIALILAAIGGYCFYTYGLPALKYSGANKALQEGRYDDAITAYKELGDYQNSSGLIHDAEYGKAGALVESGEYDEAMKLYQALADINYSDSKTKLHETKYLKAQKLVEEGEFQKACTLLDRIKTEKSEYLSLWTDATYQYAVFLRDNHDYDQAYTEFKKVIGYSDARDLMNAMLYEYATELYNTGDYEKAVKQFTNMTSRDTNDPVYLESTYQYGLQLLKSGRTKDAINTLSRIKNYSDSAAQINAAKYKYVTSHRSNSDMTTYSYLKELKAIGYQDTYAIYNNLYKWSISKIICNTSESDNRTDMSSISKDRTAYFHFQLLGGEPNSSAKVSYYLQYSSGQSNSLTYDGTWRNGQWLWTSIWWEGKGYRPSATVTLTVYVNGTAVGSRSLSRP